MAGAMANLLGDLSRDGEPSWEAALTSDPGVKLHPYGKRFAKPGRKMGHLTMLCPDPDSACCERRLCGSSSLLAEFEIH